MKCALIFEHLYEYSVKLMCRVLDVSRSGYYSWLGRGICAQEFRRNDMEEKVRETYQALKPFMVLV